MKNGWILWSDTFLYRGQKQSQASMLAIFHGSIDEP